MSDKRKMLFQRASRELGLNLPQLRRALRNLPWFVRTARSYQRARSDDSFPLALGELYPQLNDRHAQAGGFDRHYLYQDLWAARAIEQARPPQHVDVGSRLDGFITHLLTFMPVTVVDVRPLDAAIEGLSFVRADATDMAAFDDGSLPSLSSLHAVEHFGLGRYGDPIAPDAWRRALRSFVRVLAPGGTLYLSVPVGRERLAFNAHRVFAPATIIEALELELLSFAYVDDSGRFHAQAAPEDAAAASYACGMFRLTKR